MLPRSGADRETKVNLLTPPKWLYLTSLPITIAFFAWMLYNTYSLSQQWLKSCKYFGGAPLTLLDGWVTETIDLTDNQWRAFRYNIPALAVFASIYLSLGYVVKRFLCKSSKRPVIYYYVIMSFLFMAAMFQVTIIFPLSIALINFFIAKQFGHLKIGVVLTWTFNVFILFSSKHYRGYRFSEFLGWDYTWLDGHRGIVRWETYFNILFCKLISFNIDYRNSVLQNDTKPRQGWDEYKKRSCTKLDPKKDFDFVTYISYLFYIPLLIAGPVMSYNAFYSYAMKKPQRESTTKQSLWYLFRVLLYGISLDISLHFMFPNGFNDTRMWKLDGAFNSDDFAKDKYIFSSAEVASTGVLTVVYMYVKFYVIWRFFRGWALLDGINPPENLKKCVVNQYKISGFWRAWHSSLNLWIVKYIYVPMGGAKSRFVSVWFIFTFIALWHEFSTEWLAWAFLNCGVFMIEMIGTHVLAATPPVQYIKKISDNRYRPYYNLLAAASSSVVQTFGVLSQLSIMYGFQDSYLFLSRVYGESPYMIIVTLVFMFVVAECALWAESKDKTTRED